MPLNYLSWSAIDLFDTEGGSDVAISGHPSGGKRQSTACQTPRTQLQSVSENGCIAWDAAFCRLRHEPCCRSRPADILRSGNYAMLGSMGSPCQRIRNSSAPFYGSLCSLIWVQFGCDTFCFCASFHKTWRKYLKSTMAVIPYSAGFVNKNANALQQVNQ